VNLEPFVRAWLESTGVSGAGLIIGLLAARPHHGGVVAGRAHDAIGPALEQRLDRFDQAVFFRWLIARAGRCARADSAGFAP
jgi:hypothetical protein